MKWIKTRCKTILNRTSLWVQLTLFMILITTLVSAYLIHKDYTSTRTLTINNQIDTTQTILKLEVENLDNYLSELANFCIQPYYDSRFTRIVEQDNPLTSEQISYAKQQMYYYYYTRSDILDYELYLLHQNLSVGRTGSEQHFTSKDTEPEGAAEALNECEQSPLNRSMKTNDSANLIYYHSLFQIKGKVRQAVVRLELNNSYAKPLLENHAAHGEVIAFFNEKGELLFSNRPDAFPADCSYMTLVSQKKRQADGYCTIDLAEEPFLCVEAESPSSGISLVSLTPLSYIDSQIGQLRSSIIVSGIWVWLITVVMIYMLLRLLTIPLKMLSAQMQRTGEGDFRTQIHAAGSLEIRHLSDSFNSMVAHIDQLIRRTYVAELSEKDARLSALEAQLNPHFLYNTLQAISTEALVNDQPRIHKMITALASNLRYTIKGDTLVTLEREMNYVNDYIFLQKIRMDDSLEFSADIDPETLDCLIPKISIQTLVENSIIHGKSGNIETIRIEVSARYHDGAVTITVQDNGCGIAEEELAKLYADFDRQENTGKYGGIGLANLHSRLKLLYEEPASLGIETKEAEYTKIILLLPALKNRKGDTDV
ncbi:MAG: sensor histidine kinase [Bacteroidales bacterium]|nr:sensor histidine kinase [Bacteroidales bacterium]MCM1415161.1 sensor histidine kinase [bacterium]MCM1423379.1 sensor histidine kinase [bacterium]